MSLLPDLPSELLTLALDDEDKAHNSAQYRITMFVWHEPAHILCPEPKGVCDVCFAGAVMAFTLEADPEGQQIPSDYDHDTDMKLCALDEFRLGRIESGLLMMEVWWPDTSVSMAPANRKSISYASGRREWLTEMRLIIALLKSVEL